MIDGYNVEVKLLAITGLPETLIKNQRKSKSQPSEEIIEYAGRLCWDTVNRLGTNPKRIQEWIKVGHESVIEHASATFYIKASRVFTHELVRHRLASYSQRSQRYVRENEPRFIMPPELPSGSKEYHLFEKAMFESWETYRQLLELGLAPEIARYVLPNACETQIVMTMNFRELRHFIKLRTSPRALPEMRAVAGEIRRIMKEVAPRVFEDL
jgi:thymidylate synthase (FAD)